VAPVATTGNVSSGYARRGAFVRVVYLVLACLWWAVTLGGRLPRQRIVVLCYHGVNDAQRERFSRQMRRIAGRATGVAGVGPGGLGGMMVCVTFDDAFANLLRNALPITTELGIPVVVFAVSGNLGGTPRWSMPRGHPEANETIMTEAELRAASGLPGCRIGGHTSTHRPLADLAAADVARELAESKVALERITGTLIADVAAPYGSWTPEVADAARSAGYDRFFTLDPCARPDPDRPWVVGRYSMSPDAWPIEFGLTVCGSYSWLRTMRGAVRGITGLARGRRSRLGDTAAAGVSP